MSEEKKPADGQEAEPAPPELTDQDLSDVAGGKPTAMYAVPQTTDDC